MYVGHEPIEPARGNPDYHLTEDLADKAIHYLTGHVSINPANNKMASAIVAGSLLMFVVFVLICSLRF